MSRYEQIIRIVLGLVLIGLAVVVPTTWGWLGFYPLMTGIFATRPVHGMLGIGKSK